MGFSLLTIAGGFAKAATEDIEEQKKLATERGAVAAKSLFENYKKVNEENVKQAKQLAEDMQWLKSYDPNAGPEMWAEVAKNRPFMEYLKQKSKSENFDPSSIQLSKFAKLMDTQGTATALSKADTSIDLTAAANQLFKKDESKGGIFQNMIDKHSNRAYETSFRQTLGGIGVSPEEMQAAISKRGQMPESRAQIDYGYFKKEKTFDQRENDAKVALLEATKANDQQGINNAKADLLIFSGIKSELTPAQTQFANKIADIKNRYMFGTPEQRAAAKPEYDKMLADVRAEAAAKKAGEGGDKVPALGTLNTFTSAAVARKVAEVHGDLVRSKQLAIIEKPDGSASLEYTGDNPEARAKINKTAYEAAKNALSLYMTPNGEPMTRDVASVLNTYVPQSVMKSPAENTQPVAAPTQNKPLPAPSSNANMLRKEAADAIARGADRNAVAKRFKDQTGQEL